MDNIIIYILYYLLYIKVRKNYNDNQINLTTLKSADNMFIYLKSKTFNRIITQYIPHYLIIFLLYIIIISLHIYIFFKYKNIVYYKKYLFIYLSIYLIILLIIIYAYYCTNKIQHILKDNNEFIILHSKNKDIIQFALYMTRLYYIYILYTMIIVIIICFLLSMIYKNHKKK